jgi:hypothetical protein
MTFDRVQVRPIESGSTWTACTTLSSTRREYLKKIIINKRPESIGIWHESSKLE